MLIILFYKQIYFIFKWSKQLFLKIFPNEKSELSEYENHNKKHNLFVSPFPMVKNKKNYYYYL